MKHYSQLNEVERAIVDTLTQGWYLDNGEASTDPLNTFYFAYDSMEAVNKYDTTPDVNTEAMKQAIVNRYNMTQARARGAEA